MAVVGEIIRMDLRYSKPNASEMLNVFHHVVDVSDAADSEILDTLEAWITGAWAVHWQAMASNEATIEDAKVDVVDVNGLVLRSIGAFIVGIAGTQISPNVSAAVSAYMLLKSQFPKTRGSKYVPGMSEIEVQDGALTAQTIVQLGLLLLEYATTLNSAGPTELVPGVPSPSNAMFVPFLDTGILETIPAYQRRRKPSVGS